MLSRSVLILMASVVLGQTSANEPPQNGLKAFQPFMGKWKGEVSLEAQIEGFAATGDKVTANLEYAWTKNRNGISVHVSATFNGKTLDFTDGMITWDPQKKQIIGLDSLTDGGFSQYTIAIDGTRLTYTGTGATADGTPTSWTIIDDLEDSNTLKSQFVNRKEGEKKLPDGSVIVFKRAAR